MKVKVKKLHPELGKSILMPTRATPDASGYDVCAAIDTAIFLSPGERRLIPLGFALEMPSGYEAQVRPRSGLAVVDGITVLNAPGTIDAGYRGEVHVLLVNHGTLSKKFNPGDRIAQIVFASIEVPEIEVSTELSKTARGEAGFGSTGE